jgi:hypothetical protein
MFLRYYDAIYKTGKKINELQVIQQKNHFF